MDIEKMFAKEVEEVERKHDFKKEINFKKEIEK